jgi:hypothetical protein
VSEPLQKEAIFGLFEDEGGAALGLARRLREMARPYKNWPSKVNDRVGPPRALQEFYKSLSRYIELARRARVNITAPPDIKPLRSLLRKDLGRMNAMSAFTLRREIDKLASRLWDYVSRVASDEIAEDVDEGLSAVDTRDRIEKRREQRRQDEEAAAYNRLKQRTRDQAGEARQQQIEQAEWKPYFHSVFPKEKKPWMAKSKGQMTEDLVNAIESNRGMLPPGLQSSVPNLVNFVRMRAGMRVAGLMENVYETRKGDISRLMWLFFGDRNQDATDFINAVLGQMEDTWNREDFPSVDPKPAAKPEPAPVEPGPAAPPAPAGEIQVAPAAEPVPAVAPVVAPVPAAQPEAPKKGLGPAGLMPQPAMPTTIIEKGTEPIPSVKPTEERPKPRVLKPDLFRQFKKPRLGR